MKKVIEKRDCKKVNQVSNLKARSVTPSSWSSVFVDVPVLELQEGMAEQSVNFTVPVIKEELAEVIRPPLQDCFRGRLVEQIMDLAAPPVKELAEASASGAHPRAHRGTELPKKCRRRKRQQGKPDRDSEEGLLGAAMARAREEGSGRFTRTGPASPASLFGRACFESLRAPPRIFCSASGPRAPGVRSLVRRVRVGPLVATNLC